MPIFEYRCRECACEFETLVRNGDTPACPACEGEDLEKRLSAFAVGGNTPEARTAVCGTCGMLPGSCGLDG